ncbi:Retrovirus-related Pol polyprotein from transposon TNT 1-94, partial [Linum grandiflorum]
MDLRLWYPTETSTKLIGCFDSDFAKVFLIVAVPQAHANSLEMLVSWFSKKQSSVALSAVEAEYISAGSCCIQVLWLKSQLKDYGMTVSTVPMFCDNTSAINISKNLVFHSRTK